MIHQDITQLIVKCFYKVYNTLGFGFLEKVYEHAFVYELSRNGLVVRRQAPIKVYYDGIVAGEYVADVIVNGCVICELKAGDGIVQEHLAQLRNYLKATDLEVGLLLNFGPKPSFERLIFTNDRKHHPSQSV
jgi:GxxExxY protein